MPYKSHLYTLNNLFIELYFSRHEMEQFGLKTTRAYDKNSIPLCDVENCKVIVLRCNNNKINNMVCKSGYI